MNEYPYVVTVGVCKVWEDWKDRSEAEVIYRAYIERSLRPDSGFTGQKVSLSQGRVIILEYIPRPDIPLRMTAREQNMMAELCSTLRAFVYAQAIDKPWAAEVIANLLTMWVLKFEPKAQELDQLYDKFHRSGANS